MATLKWKRLGVVPRRRLRELEKHLDLVRRRDDLSIELCALYNQTGQAAKAQAILASRRFQPWEGGEGQVLGQHVRTHLLLGRAALAAGRAEEARTFFETAGSAPAHLGEARHLLVSGHDGAPGGEDALGLGVALGVGEGRDHVLDDDVGRLEAERGRVADVELEDAVPLGLELGRAGCHRSTDPVEDVLQLPGLPERPQLRTVVVATHPTMVAPRGGCSVQGRVRGGTGSASGEGREWTGPVPAFHPRTTPDRPRSRP